MSNRWNDKRWTQAGVNPAGDPIYVRGTGDPQVVNLAGLSKADLVELAEERGLTTSGTKADLIERLNG